MDDMTALRAELAAVRVNIESLSGRWAIQADELAAVRRLAVACGRKALREADNEVARAMWQDALAAVEQARGEGEDRAGGMGATPGPTLTDQTGSADGPRVGGSAGPDTRIGAERETTSRQEATQTPRPSPVLSPEPPEGPTPGWDLAHGKMWATTLGRFAQDMADRFDGRVVLIGNARGEAVPRDVDVRVLMPTAAFCERFATTYATWPFALTESWRRETTKYRRVMQRYMPPGVGADFSVWPADAFQSLVPHEVLADPLPVPPAAPPGVADVEALYRATRPAAPGEAPTAEAERADLLMGHTRSSMTCRRIPMLRPDGS